MSVMESLSLSIAAGDDKKRQKDRGLLTRDSRTGENVKRHSFPVVDESVVSLARFTNEKAPYSHANCSPVLNYTVDQRSEC